MLTVTQSNESLAFPRLTSSIVADALSRIPSAHFRDMLWVTDSITACTEMLADAVNGDRSTVSAWVRNARAGSDVRPLMSVLSAVCDSIVADAYRTAGDVTAICTFIVSLEREVLGRLALDRRYDGSDDINDPETVELAASLVRIVDLHDRDTATHLDATAVLARRIAVAMNLPAETVATIELAARLHDIGNVSVRKELLTKPGPLTPAEWDEMRLHAERGAQALHDTPNLAHLAPIVRAHHERIDGTGYPDRLCGATIPLEARVVAVADAFHAMTTERPYRRAMMPNAALRVLADAAGTQFDADVVDATFALFKYSRREPRAIA